MEENKFLTSHYTLGWVHVDGATLKNKHNPRHGQTYTHVRTQMYSHTYTYILTYMGTLIHAHTHVNTGTFSYTYVHTPYTRVCSHALMYTYVLCTPHTPTCYLPKVMFSFIKVTDDQRHRTRRREQGPQEVRGETPRPGGPGRGSTLSQPTRRPCTFPGRKTPELSRNESTTEGNARPPEG